MISTLEDLRGISTTRVLAVERPIESAQYSCRLNACAIWYFISKPLVTSHEKDRKNAS